MTGTARPAGVVALDDRRKDVLLADRLTSLASSLLREVAPGLGPTRFDSAKWPEVPNIVAIRSCASPTETLKA
jgi:hypothetical protein